MSDHRALNVAVIGCGHWGPNHVRVFSELDTTRVSSVVDLNRVRLERIRRRYPHVRVERDYRMVLDDRSIDAVVVSTPTSTHAQIAEDALSAGKHVLVEKPLCLTQWQAERLGAVARSNQRVLMVGHVFVFNSGINALRDLIARGELGRIHYLDAVRTNLGPIRGDVNALYDLGTHDISICNYLLAQSPVAVSAIGSAITQPTVQDVCFATLQYEDGTFAHLHVSWLNPRKVRTLTAVGSGKMAHWDDVDPQDTLRIFDKGLDEQPYYDSFGEFQYLLRSADVHVPAVRRTEPLLRQAQSFARWVLDGVECGCGVKEGLDVVATLEAASRSMRLGGTMCLVGAAEQADRAVAATTVLRSTAGHSERSEQRGKLREESRQRGSNKLEMLRCAQHDAIETATRQTPGTISIAAPANGTPKHATTEAAAIPQLPLPDPDEIDRVRRRCGLGPAAISRLGRASAPGTEPRYEVMLKEASANSEQVAPRGVGWSDPKGQAMLGDATASLRETVPPMFDPKEIERVRRRCQTEPTPVRV